MDPATGAILEKEQVLLEKFAIKFIENGKECERFCRPYFRERILAQLSMHGEGDYVMKKGEKDSIQFWTCTFLRH